jgi:hypothetical protein
MQGFILCYKIQGMNNLANATDIATNIGSKSWPLCVPV